MRKAGENIDRNLLAVRRNRNQFFHPSSIRMVSERVDRDLLTVPVKNQGFAAECGLTLHC